MKERVQKFGRFLSGMVMPNIGAFIAWGLIAALFIPDGWLGWWVPAATINNMVGPMLSYLLPILIGYTGGKVVGGQKGAVTGALATLGAIASTESTMFIGAMICGPLGGWCIKKFDEKMEGHIPAGFEMVVNNFSVGIIGGILAVLSIFAIGPACVKITDVLGAGVSFLVEHGLLPLTAVLVEPAKVLFLNNAINHGVFTPIGTAEALEAGKSILFMIESNPGPGLGLLLAYCVAGKGETRSSAGAAAFIQFVGGQYRGHLHPVHAGRRPGGRGLPGLHYRRAADDPQGRILRQHRGHRRGRSGELRRLGLPAQVLRQGRQPG